MKSISMICGKCGAETVSEAQPGDTVIFCPYCGSRSLLPESDRVKSARIKAEAEQLGVLLSYRKHLDFMDGARSIRRIRIAFICIFALIALILFHIFLSHIS